MRSAQHINKVDLAPYVSVDLTQMVTEAQDVRRGRPVVLTNCKTGEGIAEVVVHRCRNVLFSD